MDLRRYVTGNYLHHHTPRLIVHDIGGSIVGQIYDEFYDPRGLITQAKLAEHPVIYVAINYRLSSE